MTESGQPLRIADLAALKVLAHPLRQQILRHLARHGPATSTGLAKELGGTSGGTSYNLRVLAEHGFVAEVPERAHGRERWWRHVPIDLRMPMESHQDDQVRSSVDELHRLWLAEDMDEFGRFRTEREQSGGWQDALPYSRGSIIATREELSDFFEAYLALLRKYQRPHEETPAGARAIRTRFLAFPMAEGADGAKEGSP